jgi:signal transduction histidine kinase
MRDALDERVLVLAPVGRDAALTARVLVQAGIDAQPCPSPGRAAAILADGAGALIVADEALEAADSEDLVRAIAGQPAWSDVPVILFTAPSSAAGNDLLRLRALERLGNVTVLERPVRILSLLSTVRTALRARRRQYEVRELLSQLEGRVSERDRFLAILGHELRNPLAAILAAAQVMEAATVDAAAQQRMRAIVERRARHVARLVDDLLEVARVTSGKIVLKRAPVDLADLVRRSAQAIDPVVRERALTLTVSAAAPVWVEGDALRLDQIVGNLLANAAKYTPSGGRIQVSVRRAPPEAVVEVRDTGVGIPPDVLPRLFHLFAQAEETLARAGGGLGIGLALARSLVELHGGRITAQSRGPGTGSLFTVHLPLAAEAALPPPPAARPAATEGRLVLIVEDDPDVRESLAALIRPLGHSIHTAADGLQGIQNLVRLHPDVALVDIAMPGIDGYELARRARASACADVHLIALTGYGRPEDRRRALDAGFDVHVAKPVDAQQLAALIAAAPRRS